MSDLSARQRVGIEATAALAASAAPAVAAAATTTTALAATTAAAAAAGVAATHGDSGVDDDCGHGAAGGSVAVGTGGVRPEGRHRPAEVVPPSARLGTWEDVIRAIPAVYDRTATSLWKLLGKAVKAEVHARQLRRYLALGAVPRGLRVKNEPLTLRSGGAAADFLADWFKYAEAASFELMRMLADEHERQLADARARIAACYDELRRGLTREQFALVTRVYNGEAKRELQRMQDVVESKLRRDAEEYGRNRAAPPRPPSRPLAGCGGGGVCEGGADGSCCSGGGGGRTSRSGRGGGGGRRSRNGGGGCDCCGGGWSCSGRNMGGRNCGAGNGAASPPPPIHRSARPESPSRGACQWQWREEHQPRRERRDPSINSLIEGKKAEIQQRGTCGVGVGAQTG